MSIKPYAIGVCSWSLQVKSIPELSRLLDGLGVSVIQLACGDPHHAAWEEGDRKPRARPASRSPP
jgi:L-ribulose-5-phosphate 3-epimerase